MKIKKGVMEKTKIKINKTEIELLEYIPDFYSMSRNHQPTAVRNETRNQDVGI